MQVAVQTFQSALQNKLNQVTSEKGLVKDSRTMIKLETI